MLPSVFIILLLLWWKILGVHYKKNVVAWDSKPWSDSGMGCGENFGCMFDTELIVESYWFFWKVALPEEIKYWMTWETNIKLQVFLDDALESHPLTFTWTFILKCLFPEVIE